MEVIIEANEYILDALTEKESSDKKDDDDDHTNLPEGGFGSDESENDSDSEGTLILDVTLLWFRTNQNQTL